MAALVALGQKVYANNCAACHGAKLEGQPDSGRAGLYQEHLARTGAGCAEGNYAASATVMARSCITA
ncbi:c-type cytochrome [Eoetvoesiella caeni]|uniref:c-type cytochrome n=1 Tax=Eoetvoesiella caeni TaxID=645616 RepID=UPI001FE37F78|nr:c-type cytochrome [Eoetvoesiella caeni]